MSAASTVGHLGVVKIIEHNLIRVSILSKSACGSCHAKGACSLGESEEKMIDVFHNDSTTSFSIGEHVEVVMHESMGLKALFLGYLLPFLAVLSTLIVLISVTGDEKLSGLVSLATLIPYYISLYFFGNSLKKTFSFSVKKIENP